MVRTVQYYDTRGILIPSELSKGGRRLYSEDDPESVISLILDQQETILKKEIDERKEQLQKRTELKSELKNVSEFSVESISDTAYTMTNKLVFKKDRLSLSTVPYHFQAGLQKRKRITYTMQKNIL